MWRHLRELSEQLGMFQTSTLKSSLRYKNYSLGAYILICITRIKLESLLINEKQNRFQNLE